MANRSSVGVKVFPSRQSEKIRESTALIHYSRGRAPTEPSIDYETIRAQRKPKITDSGYRVSTLPTRIIDEPDYESDEVDRLSSRGSRRSEEDIVPRRPVSRIDDRPPHRTSPISSSPARPINSSRRSSVEPVRHHHYQPPIPPYEHVSTVYIQPSEARERAAPRRRLNTATEESRILNDLDTILDEQMTFDEARERIKRSNITFRQYATTPGQINQEYDYVEYGSYEQITPEEARRLHRVIKDKEQQMNREEEEEGHRRETSNNGSTNGRERVHSPEVVERMRRMATKDAGRPGGSNLAAPLLNEIIVQDLKSVNQQGIRGVNQNRRKKAEEMYAWTESEIDRLRMELSPEFCLQHTPTHNRETNAPIPEWKRRLIAKKLSQEAIDRESARLWDEFDEWRALNDPAWTPKKPKYNIPILR